MFVNNFLLAYWLFYNYILYTNSEKFFDSVWCEECIGFTIVFFFYYVFEHSCRQINLEENYSKNCKKKT